MNGKIIKKFRQSKDLTQQELADFIGVTKSFISLVENNINKLSDDKIKLIEKKYNVDLSNYQMEYLANCINLPFVTASAGGGILIHEENTYPVPVNEIQNLGINFEDLLLVRIEGNSMAPVINHGDILVITKNCMPIMDGSIYVLSFEERLLCKKLLTGAKYTILKSENQDYPAEKIEGQELGKLNIIGKVVYRMNKF